MGMHRKAIERLLRQFGKEDQDYLREYLDKRGLEEKLRGAGGSRADMHAPPVT